jgi:hypothetical protein
MSDLKENIECLLQLLSYTRLNGWIKAEEFDSALTHRFALSQARDQMGVVGAFCWLSGQNNFSVSAPLVYVALANDELHAQSVHRKVWSQGLTPFLIIATPSGVIVCQGFRFVSDQWSESVYRLEWKDVSNFDLRELGGKGALSNLRAEKLRSSLFWREHSIDVSGRVDQQLLIGLSALSYKLINEDGKESLPHNAANGLIGKILYLYFLADRGVISQEWLNSRGHSSIVLDVSGGKWDASSFWTLLDDLDSIFNGSIFPLATNDRQKISIEHIDLAKRVLKHGAELHGGGALQLSLLDIDLSVLRVETLSAVYEQFLENVKCGERRQQGAYYTPPFLVDLVLDRVECELPFEDGMTVLDPSAGSGVFLVGAYRRILEKAREKGSVLLSLECVRDLLVRNIFGVERNQDACNVAAFSLYLTMLDYVSPRDLSFVAAGKDPQKLFPSLLGTNLFAKDFFDPDLAGAIPPIRCVVGNPPWQTLGKLDSPMGQEWYKAHPDCPIGKDQAAEVFIWKALSEHLDENGVLAMLIPSKSFVNPTAKKFRFALQEKAFITGAINFSHLRHRLFAGAKHPCAAIFLRNRKPTEVDWSWVYTPLSISQPVASKDVWPWTLVMDKAEVSLYRHGALASDSRGWFEAFVLRPVDRQIQQFIFDSSESGKILRLEWLCEKVGAKHKRGGNSIETGLSASILNRTSTVDATYHRVPLQDLFGDVPSISTLASDDALSVAHLSKVTESYKNQFSGNVLLIPRNLKDIRFVSYPKAFTSSYLAVYFDKLGKDVVPRERKLLEALGKYLSSDVALYFFATIGRRWLMDRRNIEPTDLANIPVPFSSLDDPRIDKILSLEGAELEAFLLAAFELDAGFNFAIKEFLRFRMGFQDGNVPKDALAVPSSEYVTTYLEIFLNSLDGLVGREGAFDLSSSTYLESGEFVMAVQYVDDDTSASATVNPPSIRNFDLSKIVSGNPFADSLAMTVDADRSIIFIVKPLEYFRWTVDCAYADSRRVLDRLMEEVA